MSAFTNIHVTGTGWRDVCDQALAEVPAAQPGRLAFIYVSER